MATSKVESRLAVLEAKVAQLEQRLDSVSDPKKHWIDEVVGVFADDPDFLEAMRLGRRYRESLRPKPERLPRKKIS